MPVSVEPLGKVFCAMVTSCAQSTSPNLKYVLSCAACGSCLIGGFPVTQLRLLHPGVVTFDASFVAIPGSGAPVGGQSQSAYVVSLPLMYELPPTLTEPRVVSAPSMLIFGALIFTSTPMRRRPCAPTREPASP